MGERHRPRGGAEGRLATRLSAPTIAEIAKETAAHIFGFAVIVADTFFDSESFGDSNCFSFAVGYCIRILDAAS